MKTLSEPLLGTVYLVEENLSMKRQLRDLEVIKENGLNLIVLWPPVSPWDSADGVSYAFDSCDKIMEKCHELGLKVIVELEGQNPAFQFAPDYKYKPEHTTVSDKARHWVNYFHPEVQEQMREFCLLIAKHYKDAPALYGYDVFNEVNFHSTDIYTEGEFKKWLKAKYGDIRNLNKIWKRFYTSYDQIILKNIYFNYSRWSSMRHWLDFEEFRADMIQRLVKLWGDTIREVDKNPDHLIIADNSWSMTTFDTTILGNDDWKVSQVVDSFGLSVYPQSWDVRLRDNPCRVSQIYCGGISAGKDSRQKPIMISELQTHNQTALAKGSSVFEDIKLWTWQAFMHGAEGLVYWKWNPFTTGFQVGGRGMTAMDGTPNERAEQASQCAKVLNENKEIFLGRETVHHKVHLVYNPEVDRFSDYVNPDEQGVYRDSIASWYKYFWLKGIQPRFIKPEDLETLKVDDETIVVASLLTMVSKKEAKMFRDYLGKGGKLIADSRFGLVDENGFAYENSPGEMTDLFGFREMDWLSPYTSEKTKIDRFSRIELNKGEVLWKTDLGEPGVIKNGNIFYMAFPFGVEKVSDEVVSLVDSFIKESLNKEFEIIEKDELLDLVVSTGHGLLVGVANYSYKKAKVKLKLPNHTLSKNLWPDAKVSAIDGVVTIEVPPRDVGGVLFV